MASENPSLNYGTAVPLMGYAENAATTFNGGKNKYSIDNMTYPSDLHDDMYGGNMVVFYININNASKFQTDGNSNMGSISMSNLDIPRIRMTTEAVPQTALGLTGAAIGSTAAKDIAIGTLGGMASGVWNAISGYASGGMAGATKAIGTGMVKGFGAGATAALAQAGVGALTLGAAASIGGTTTREQKRLTTAIALHVPNQVNVKYSTSWEATDTADLYMTSAVGSEALKAITLDNNSNLTGVGKEVAANIGLSTGKNAGAVSAATGLAPNPRKELVFKGVDYRTFQFDYDFFPRDEIEAKKVESIINAFKFHMQPEFKDSNSFLYLYPSEFDITYYTGHGTENLHLNRHTSCVLTDLSINYTPNGHFTTFANGMPTQIKMSLTFKELTTMSKELIIKGL